MLRYGAELRFQSRTLSLRFFRGKVHEDETAPFGNPHAVQTSRLQRHGFRRNKR